MGIVEDCGLTATITEDDVTEIKRVGTVKADSIQPLLIKLSTVEMKKSLFRKLGVWRAKQQADNDRDHLAKIPHIDHDYTVEQRKEQ